MIESTNSHRRVGMPMFSSIICLAILVATGVTVAAQGPAFQPLTMKSKMAINGIGPVRIGAPLLKTIDLSSTEWKIFPALDESDCRYANPIDTPRNAEGNSAFTFMVVKGIIVRAEVLTAGVSTVSGIQVGDTETKVKAAYPGKIKAEQHPYDPNGHYLIYTPTDKKDANFRLIFETDGKVVTRYRAGRIPEVNWVEGCL